MPQQMCPGAPLCQKSFGFASALRAHELSCPHARRRFERKLLMERVERELPRPGINVVGPVVARERAIAAHAAEAAADARPAQPGANVRSGSISPNVRFGKGGSGGATNAAIAESGLESAVNEATALALRRQLKKGNLIISRRGAPSDLVDPEKPAYRREYTTYWALSDLPSLARTFTPRRDHVTLLLHD